MTSTASSFGAEQTARPPETEVDGNRTRQTEMLGLDSFEDCGDHQAADTSPSKPSKRKVGLTVPTTLAQLLAEARARLERLTPAQAQTALTAGATLIDIRGADQTAHDGTIDGALVIARNVLEWRLAPDSDHRHPQAPGPDGQVILICNEGYQSSLAAATLQDLGVTRATDVVDGFVGWRAAGLPITAPDAAAGKPSAYERPSEAASSTADARRADIVNAAAQAARGRPRPA